VALKALRTLRSPERARKVRFFLTVSTLLLHASSPVHQRLERELLNWGDLHHQNVLPFYGAYVPQTLLLNYSHGHVGVVTDIGQRLYMVGGPFRARKGGVDFNLLR
jgi:hypothetical protein